MFRNHLVETGQFSKLAAKYARELIVHHGCDPRYAHFQEEVLKHKFCDPFVTEKNAITVEDLLGD
jgi:hypothetical protein